MSGLRGGDSVSPARPRPSTTGVSPRRNPLRSMPEEKVPPAPVRTPTDSEAFVSSWSSAAATPVATAPLTALRASGRLMVMTRTLPRVSTRTSSCSARETPPCSARESTSLTERLPPEDPGRSPGEATITTGRRRRLRASPKTETALSVDSVDQAPTQRNVGAELETGKREQQGPGGSDPPGQAHRPAGARDQSHADLGQPERRVGR